MLSTANRRPPPSALNLEAAKAKYVPRTFDKHRMPLPLKPTQIVRRDSSPSSSPSASIALPIASTQRTSAWSVRKSDLEHERMSHTAAILGAAAAVPDTSVRVQHSRRATSSSIEVSMQNRIKDALDDVYDVRAATIVTAVRARRSTVTVSARAAVPVGPHIVQPQARRPQPSIDDVATLQLFSAPVAKPKRTSTDSFRSSRSSCSSEASGATSSRYSSADEAPRPSTAIRTHIIDRANVTPIGARAAARVSCDSSSSRSTSSSESGLDSERSFYSRPSAMPQVSGLAVSLFSALGTDIPARPVVSLTPFLAVTPDLMGRGDAGDKEDFWDASMTSAKSGLQGNDAAAGTRPTMAGSTTSTNTSEEETARPLPTVTVNPAMSDNGAKPSKSPASKATIPSLQQQVHMILRDRHAVSAAVGRLRSEDSRRSSDSSLSSGASSYSTGYDSDSSEPMSLPEVEYDNDHLHRVRALGNTGAAALPDAYRSPVESSAARSSCSSERAEAHSPEPALQVAVTDIPPQPQAGPTAYSRPTHTPPTQDITIDKPPAAAMNASAYSYRTVARSNLPTNIERPKLGGGSLASRSQVPLKRGNGSQERARPQSIDGDADDERVEIVEQDDTIDCSRPWVWGQRAPCKAKTEDHTAGLIPSAVNGTLAAADVHPAATLPAVPIYRFEPPPTYSRRRSSPLIARNGLPGCQTQRRAGPQLQLGGDMRLRVSDDSWKASGPPERYISAATSPASVGMMQDLQGGDRYGSSFKAGQRGRLSIILPPQPTMFGSGKTRAKIQIVGC